MRLFVLDPDTVHGRALASSLGAVRGVEGVAHAPSARDALRDPRLLQADVVLVAEAIPAARHVAAAVRERTTARVILCAPDRDGPDAPRLTEREQQVLSLIAAGHPTREVASQLCYSERTVKHVLHDVSAKLGARTRSQAVARAVREGLI